MTRADAWKKRKCVVDYWCYKENLSAYLCYYEVPAKLQNLTFILPMPKSWSKKKKAEMNNTPHQSKPDLDNLIKAFKDCLCDNDSYVHTYNNIKKIWGYEGAIELDTGI